MEKETKEKYKERVVIILNGLFLYSSTFFISIHRCYLFFLMPLHSFITFSVIIFIFPLLPCNFVFFPHKFLNLFCLFPPFFLLSCHNFKSSLLVIYPCQHCWLNNLALCYHVYLIYFQQIHKFVARFLILVDIIWNQLPRNLNKVGNAEFHFHREFKHTNS